MRLIDVTGCIALTGIVAFAAAAMTGEERGRRSSVQPPTGPPPAPVASIDSPTRVVLGRENELLVSDYGGMKILAVARDSFDVIASFPVQGKPIGLAFDGQRVYVGNESLDRVEAYTPDGEFLYEFDTPIDQPNDIAVSSELGLVYVVATQAKAVKVFQLDGTFVRSIPDAGELPLSNPTGVALIQIPLPSDVNGDGNVDVLDLLAILGAWQQSGVPEDVTGDGIVDVLDLLEVLAHWGAIPAPPQIIVSDFGDAVDAIEPGLRIYDQVGKHLQTLEGAFSRPQGLLADGVGHVFLVDAMLSQVLVLDQGTGEVIKTLGEYGCEPGQMRLPLDLAIEPGSLDVFVTSNLCERIEGFPGGATLP